MNIASEVHIYVIPGLEMLLVAILAVVAWQRMTDVQLRWFWIGAGLWTGAVILKVICAVLFNASAVGFLKGKLPYPVLIVVSGLFLGIESSAFEMGVTWLAVRRWRQLGRDARRAFAIGVGAGAFEALLLGLATLTAGLSLIAGVADAEDIGEGMQAGAASTPLYWLVAPTERSVALLGHTSTRVLILLGVVNRKPLMVLGGFLIFALGDAIAGAFLISSTYGAQSLWWLELALLPFALVNIPILFWCYRHWRNSTEKDEDAVKAESTHTLE